MRLRCNGDSKIWKDAKKEVWRDMRSVVWPLVAWNHNIAAVYHQNAFTTLLGRSP